jgi:hypothetical protein
MAYGLYKADQLALIGGDLEMSSCKWPDEEGDGIKPDPEASQSTMKALLKSGR